MNHTKKIAVSSLGAVAILASGIALAATQNFTASVRFAAPLVLTKVADPNFGTLKAGSAASYSLSTAGVVTTSGLGEVISTTGTQSGQLTIAGSSLQTIDISAGNYTANNAVTPSNARCAYNGGGAVAGCSISNAVAPGAGKTLLIGLDIAADGSQADGSTASPTFDVVVVYH